MTKKHSRDAELFVGSIDNFVNGKQPVPKINNSLRIKPAESLILARPFTSRRATSRLANVFFAPQLKAIKKSFAGYFAQNDRIVEHFASSVDEIKATIADDTLIKTLFDQKIYEIAKLNDRLKSELMAEINKNVSPVAGPRKEIVTKIINKEANTNYKKLNLGSGSFLKEGYINIDHREIEGVDVVADIEKLPYEEDTLEEVYLSHVAEHFTERKLTELLRYWYSLLAKNGSIVIVVPDIEAMTRQFVEGDITWDNLRLVILGGQDYNSDYHFNAFSTSYIESVVKKTLPKADYVLLDSARKNGECLELEIKIRKP